MIPCEIFSDGRPRRNAEKSFPNCLSGILLISIFGVVATVYPTEEILHQLKTMVYPIIYRVSTILSVQASIHSMFVFPGQVEVLSQVDPYVVAGMRRPEE